jgi:hypothetical protein
MIYFRIFRKKDEPAIMHVLINNSGDVEPKKIGSHLGLQTLSSTDEIFPAQVTEIHVAGCDGLAQAHPIPQPKRAARMTSLSLVPPSDQ